MNIFAKLSIALIVALVTLGVAGTTIPRTCHVKWQGSTNLKMLEQVQKDMSGQCDVVVASLFSGGGPVDTSIEIAQEIRRARKRGVTVEIHGRAIVASGGVIVLAAGTPGHRYIARNSLTVLHGLQVGSFFGSECYDGEDLTSNDNDFDLTEEFAAILSQNVEQIVYEMVLAGANEEAAREAWTSCYGEYVGDGSSLIELGIADHLED